MIGIPLFALVLILWYARSQPRTLTALVKTPTAQTSVAPLPAPASTIPQNTYTVAAGDTLSSLARKYYGSDSKFNRDQIYNANAAKIGKNPNNLHVGIVLVIPYDEHAATYHGPYGYVASPALEMFKACMDHHDYVLWEVHADFDCDGREDIAYMPQGFRGAHSGSWCVYRSLPRGGYELLPGELNCPEMDLRIKCVRRGEGEIVAYQRSGWEWADSVTYRITRKGISTVDRVSISPALGFDHGKVSVYRNGKKVGEVTTTGDGKESTEVKPVAIPIYYSSLEDFAARNGLMNELKQARGEKTVHKEPL